MKLPERHRKSLLTNTEEYPSMHRGPYYWTNQKYLNSIIKNVHKVEFNKMYPHILLLLKDEGIVDFYEYEGLRIIIEDLPNCSMDNKIFANSLYGFLTKTNKKVIDFLHEYLYILYDEILVNNYDNLIYIDSDIIFSTSEVNMGDCPLPYEKSKLSFGLFKKMKTYATYNLDNDFLSIKCAKREYDQLKYEIDTQKRELKIDKILNSCL